MKTKNTPEPVAFISTLAETKGRPAYDVTEGALAVSPRTPVKLAAAIVEERLKEAIEKVTQHLNSLEHQDGAFALDTAEMTFQIDQSGKVNVLVGDVGGSVKGGFKFTWKRRNSS